MLIQSNSLKKTKSSDKGINKSNYHINRGFELLLTGGKKKPKPSHIIIINLGGRNMLAISLVFGSFLTIMFLIIGIKLGIGISIPGQQNASIALLSRSCLRVDLYLLPTFYLIALTRKILRQVDRQ